MKRHFQVVLAAAAVGIALAAGAILVRHAAPQHVAANGLPAGREGARPASGPFELRQWRASAAEDGTQVAAGDARSPTDASPRPDALPPPISPPARPAPPQALSRLELGAQPIVGGRRSTPRAALSPEPLDGTSDAGIPTPVARVALEGVGVDPAAELVWSTAINDVSLPAEDRKNLIEDLNETGFPDPKHVTPDDLPLIVSRLRLIEQMAPDAMDQVNADAFDEAYKDLANMYRKVAP